MVGPRRCPSMAECIVFLQRSKKAFVPLLFLFQASDAGRARSRTGGSGPRYHPPYAYGNASGPRGQEGGAYGRGRCPPDWGAFAHLLEDRDGAVARAGLTSVGAARDVHYGGAESS